MIKMKYVIFLVGYSIISGCASKGSYTPTGAYIKDIDKSLQSGDIRLTCDTSCSGAWGSKRKHMKGLYENELWKDLALTVGNLGFRSDQTYYYLGRSAEGLGYIDAARTYYKLSKASYKCHGFINNCDGLVFPKEVDKRLDSLPFPKETTVLSKSDDKAPETVMVKSNSNEESKGVIIESSDENKVPNKTISTDVYDGEKYPSSSKSINIKNKDTQKVVSSPLVFKSKSAFLRDIVKLKNSPLVKKPLETNAEFNSRVSQLINKHTTNAYRIQFDINNQENKTDGIAYYNPETNTLKVTLPRVESDLVWMKISGKRELKWLSSSYLEVKKDNIRTRSYSASNKLGVTVDVSKVEYESYGLAVLSTATSDYNKDNTQMMLVTLSRDRARNILIKGKMELEVAVDSQYLEDDEMPLIFNDNYEHEPTIDKPIHFIEKKYKLPVRLIKMSLLNEKGDVVATQEGKQVRTSAIRR